MAQKTRKKEGKKKLHRSSFRRWHSIAGLISSVFLCGLAISGVYLNHQDDFFRTKEMPLDQQSITATLQVNQTQYLGSNRGIYKLDNGVFESAVLLHPIRNIVGLSFVDQQFWVLTRSGLLLRTLSLETPLWIRTSLPESSGEAISFNVSGSIVLLSTSTGVFKSTDFGETWQNIVLQKGSLRSFMTQLHSGWIAAPWLIYAHDLSAIILLFLIVSGVVIYVRLLRIKK